jgi:hypothetical protein
LARIKTVSSVPGGTGIFAIIEIPALKRWAIIRREERPHFCGAQKAGMVTRYGEPGFVREGRGRFRRGEQAEHFVGKRQGLGGGGRAFDF